MIIEKPEIIPQCIINPVNRIVQSSYTVFTRMLFSPPPPIPIPGLNQIFNIRDTSGIEFSTRYEDIPIQYNQNRVFKEFICVLTQKPKPIRYPAM